LLIYNN
jgi:ABC-type uncharacterized transport system fused permease/ATPase subunit